MHIARICYPVTALGPGKRAGIWLTGCKRDCPGCMSPELKSMESGRDLPIERVIGMLESIQTVPDGVSISGGEPFLQPRELGGLVSMINTRICRDIIVYSGFTLDELRAMHDFDVDGVLDNISVLIDGPYVDAQNDGRGIRGSSNQTVHVFRRDADYSELSTCARSVQSFRYDGKLLLVGIQ